MNVHISYNTANGQNGVKKKFIGSPCVYVHTNEQRLHYCKHCLHHSSTELSIILFFATKLNLIPNSPHTHIRKFLILKSKQNY